MSRFRAVTACCSLAFAAALLPMSAAVAAPITNAPIAHGFPRVGDHATSGNWAGYAAVGGRYTSVTATWKQPAVNCSVTRNAYSSFWIGLDGDGSSSVEQTGSEADCASGHAEYSAWYEMYPQPSMNIGGTVRPGDVFTSSVTTDGSGNFTLVLKDTTEGWSRTVHASYSRAALASAEAIAEAPSSGGVLPLADFGTASFSSVKVNGKTIGSYRPQAITMASGSTEKASTSGLSGGDAFNVTWHHE